MKVKNIKSCILKVIDIMLLLFLIGMTSMLVINLVNLANIENLIRGIVIVVLVLLTIFVGFLLRKKKIISRIIIILLCSLYGFLNYNFYRVYASLDNITTTVETKVVCLVTSLDDVNDIDSMTDSEIGILNKNMDSEVNEFANDLINDEGLDNLLVEYNDYLEIINALLNKEISYAFLPENYNDIYNNANSSEEKIQSPFKVLHKEEKEIEKEDEVNTKDINEPFTILLMGTDIILDSYNADTLVVMTINPKTMNATMLSIPRDTYATIACTGGRHKINASGWYGDSCVVKTVEKYLDIKIDYYAKLNFGGMVSLVDKIGGIEVDVPYAFCEQNSRREFGSQMIYVDAGIQTLNGEQALALTRNRHYWSGMCPSKYTTDGERSDLTRGKNQQLVIKGIMNKLMTVRDLNTFYDILDTLGSNMTTNMSRETILSFYNLGKKVLKKLNTSSMDEIVNINRLTLKSYFQMIYLSGMDLSTIVNYEESIAYVSREMKKNLGLIKKEEIKSFSFDINDAYDEDTIKYKTLTSKLRLLPDFVGKTVGEAISYCNSNGLNCDKGEALESSIIISQSIAPKSDLVTIGKKQIVFEVESVDDTTIKDKENEENKDKTEDEDKIEEDSDNQDNQEEDDNLVDENKKEDDSDNIENQPDEEITEPKEPDLSQDELGDSSEAGADLNEE